MFEFVYMRFALYRKYKLISILEYFNKFFVNEGSKVLSVVKCGQKYRCFWLLNVVQNSMNVEGAQIIRSAFSTSHPLSK
ncbi:hypothetical protein BKG89_06825 [Rodentibacter caecimuris]|uniref:ESPR domain-containing protein n=1 Tax=Rodentibacter caecimuris TaxID=1796644 RepID=A0ABX3KXM9_9PAST|nr:hypothetical protein BKG89_06825 [Rodentibacter heylii]